MWIDFSEQGQPKLEKDLNQLEKNDDDDNDTLVDSSTYVISDQGSRLATVVEGQVFLEI